MLRQGQSPGELMPLLMLQMLEKQSQPKNRSSSSSADFGDLDDSGLQNEVRDMGLKAVRNLQTMRNRITKDPLPIVKSFEASVRDELGLVPGQAWTLRQWLETIHWGRFQSLKRAAYMDVALYEHLRRGDVNSALAQCAQNLKGKVQVILDEGDWNRGWHLTGLPKAPFGKKEFVGDDDELAIITAFEKQMIDIRKRQKEVRANLESHHGAPAAEKI